MNYKTLDVITTENYTTNDHKHILNLSPENCKINDVIQYMDSHCYGIDSDNVGDLKLPVCFYQTQMTIHGIFNDFDPFFLKVKGYKSIIQNKNKSIGVRYVAIDSHKRDFIIKYLSLFGIKRKRSSTDDYFYSLTVISDKTDVKAVIDGYQVIKKRMDTIKDKIDGRCNIKIVSMPYYGKFVLLEFSINMIRQEDVILVTEALCGKTIKELDDDIKIIEAEETKEVELREIKHKEDSKKARIAEDNIRRKLSDFGFRYYSFEELSSKEFVVADVSCYFGERTDFHKRKLIPFGKNGRYKTWETMRDEDYNKVVAEDYRYKAEIMSSFKKGFFSKII